MRLRNVLGVVAIFLAIVFAWFWQGVWLGVMLDSTGKARLEKDALGFYSLAKESRPFYAASLREPLFPALLRVGLKLFRPPDEHLFVRQFTGAIGLALIAVIGTLGWRLAGPVGGALAAWLFAGSTATVYYAISGLREPLVLLLVVLLASFVVGAASPPRPGESGRGGDAAPTKAALAVIGAALPLIRLEYLAVLPLILTGWVALAGHDWKRRFLPAVVAVALAWAVTVPFLIACQQEFGSCFALTANHATYWRNHELAGRPGQLTREEVMTNPYGGQRVTTAAYIFRDHSLPAVVARYAQGYWISLTQHIPAIFSWDQVRNPLVWFWVAGVGWAARSWRRHGIVPLAAVLVQFPFAFIVPLDTVMPGREHPGVEIRFSLPLAPFVAVLAAYGMVETLRWTVRAVSSRRHDPSPSSGTSQTGSVSLMAGLPSRSSAAGRECPPSLGATARQPSLHRETARGEAKAGGRDRT